MGKYVLIGDSFFGTAGDSRYVEVTDPEVFAAEHAGAYDDRCDEIATGASRIVDVTQMGEVYDRAHTLSLVTDGSIDGLDPESEAGVALRYLVDAVKAAVAADVAGLAQVTAKATQPIWISANLYNDLVAVLGGLNVQGADRLLSHEVLGRLEAVVTCR